MLAVLVGYRGTGKTTIAPLVAQALGLRAVDMDELIVRRTGRSIREIFESEGESTFREIESTILRELLQQKGIVVAAGGGVVVRDQNRQLLGRVPVVWLRASAETISRRLQRDPASSQQRPALTTLSAEDEIRFLLRQRELLYAAVADLVLDTDDQPPERIAEVIAGWLRARCSTAREPSCGPARRFDERV